MSNATPGSGYRLYWITWVFLLLVTMIMLAMEYVSWPQWILLTVLLLAMLLKASVISGYFMHLRFEKPALIIVVAASILLVAAVLFVLLAIDALRVHQLSSG
ncbi:MAG: cytochrome C oxidase subunit IV family protein [Acidobacteria bacterium]|nr:cytochrome C oxidase subunit IV family protein [Acidobacteriota bacterium]